MEKTFVDKVVEDCIIDDISYRVSNPYFGTSIRNLELFNVIGRRSKLCSKYETWLQSNIENKKGLIYFCSQSIFPLLIEYAHKAPMSYSNMMHNYSYTDNNEIRRFPYKEEIFNNSYNTDQLFRPQFICYTDEMKYNIDKSETDIRQLHDSLRGFRCILDMLIEMKELDSVIHALDILHGLNGNYRICSKAKDQIIELIFSIQNVYDVEIISKLNNDYEIGLLNTIYRDNFRYLRDRLPDDKIRSEYKEEILEDIVKCFKKYN